MPSLSGLMVLVFLLPPQASAQEPTETQKKLRGFTESKRKLEAEIDRFLLHVEACNPPTFKTAITDGFGDPSKPTSAKGSLNILEKNVADHVAAAEIKFTELRKAKAGNCTDASALRESAASIGKETQVALEEDLNGMKKGVQEAARKKSMILKLLAARETMIERSLAVGVPADRVPGLPPGSVEACKAAVEQVAVMESANGNVLASLTDLQTSFGSRVVLEQGALSRSVSCAEGSVHKASFEGESSGEAEPGQSEGTAI